MFFQTLSQEVLHMEPVSDIFQAVFSRIKRNTNTMCVGYTTLDVLSEASFDESWCLIDNQSTCNDFINSKYLSNIVDDSYGECFMCHYNAGITFTKNIGDLPRYSNTIWYNLKGRPKILSLRLVQKHHLVTYNSQYWNEFVVHIPQCPTFNMTKAGLFYHNMRHLIKYNKIMHIMIHGHPYKIWRERRNSTPAVM